MPIDSTVRNSGLYTNAPYTVSLDNQSPVFFQGMDVDLPPDLQVQQTRLFLKDDLSETGNHTVTLKNTDSNPIRPFSFDYAVIRSR